MRRWIAAALIGAALAALSAGARPWKDAATGIYDPPDIAQDVAAARLFAARENPYGPAIRQMHAQTTGISLADTYPYFPHPPFSLIISLFTAFVPFPMAALLWFALSLALLFMLAALLSEFLWSPTERSGRGVRVAALFVLFLAWPPTLYNLEKGQWTIVLTLLIVLGWRALNSGQPGVGGAWLGTAAAVKVFPVLLGAYLFFRSRRGLRAFLIAGAVATGIPLLWLGPRAFGDFIEQSQMNLPNWETFPSVMFSLHGVFARLFIGSNWAVPLVHAPGLGRLLELAVTLLFLSLSIRMTVRARKAEASEAAAFSSWVALLPVLNPQSMGHNGLLLSLPIVLTLVLLREEPRVWPRAMWTLGIVLASIPRQTLWRLAPAPVTPWGSVAVLALPMWGALLLFVVALSITERTTAPRTVGK